jgi:uncharacterized protein
MRWVLAVAIMLSAALAAAGADTRLIDAVKRGDRQSIRLLLDQHADTNAREVDGTSALHWAVRSDDVGAMELLIRAGANVNASNRYGVTPLSLAATNASARAVAMLLKAGAAADAVLPGGETPLMTASRSGNPDAVRLLLEAGAHPNARESNGGETALMWAAAEDHGAVVALLVRHGADLNAAADVLEYPKVKVDAATMVVTALPHGGLTPLMYAARQGAVAAARALVAAGANLNRIDPDGTSALTMAIINAHFDVAALLVDAGADLEIADVSGMGPLYAAVDMHTLDPMVNRPPPRPTGRLDAAGLVSMLLDYGANPDAALKAPLLMRQHNGGDPTLGAGATPLMRAAKNGDVVVMRSLVDAGANPNGTTRAGMMPLLFAMNPGRRKPPAVALEAVRVCLDAGANVNAADTGGATPLHAAVAQGDAALDIVKLLVDRGAALDAKDRQGRTPLDVALASPAPAGGRGGRGRGGTDAREAVAAFLRERSSAALPQR